MTFDDAILDDFKHNTKDEREFSFEGGEAKVLKRSMVARNEVSRLAPTVASCKGCRCGPVVTKPVKNRITQVIVIDKVEYKAIFKGVIAGCVHQLN